MRPVPVTLPFAVVFLALLGVQGCRSRPQVLVPAPVDLQPHARIGLVTFSAQGARGALAPLATQRFLSAMLAAQPGIEVLELGELPGPIDAAAARRLGEEHGLRSVVAGQLEVSDLKPRVSILGGLRASAEANVGLTVRMFATGSGATVWTREARVRETIANVSVVDGQAVLGAQDPDEAYGELVDVLVWEVTQDFRSRWVRQ